jgi:hypothetical protein
VTATDLESGRQHSQRLKLSGPSEQEITKARAKVESEGAN